MFQTRKRFRFVFVFALYLILFPGHIFSSSPPASIYNLSPPSWYAGFSDTFLEIVFHAENADLLEISMEDYMGVRFLGKTNSANRHVAYLQLNISQKTEPGVLKFSAKPAFLRIRYVKSFKFTYTLHARSSKISELESKDIVYHSVLDKFYNGNQNNDKVYLKNPYDFNTKDPMARQGGDLTGLINGIDYLHNLGVTALWLNPIQENDAPMRSAFGRSITHHYLVDPRLGRNDQIKPLQNALAKAGIKLIMDLDINQIGWFHWLNLNFDTGWFNSPDSAIHSLPDPVFFNNSNLSETEKKWIANHWMDPTLPDLNQKNFHIRYYLKQFCMWWTEFAGVSAWIVPDPQLIEKSFSNYIQWEVQRDFPNVKFIANTTTNSTKSQSDYVLNKLSLKPVQSFNGIADYAIFNCLTQIAKTDTCDRKYWNDLFNTLEMQCVYSKPHENLIFMDEIYGKGISASYNQNKNRWKMLMGLSYTLPGTLITNMGIDQISKGSFNNGSFYPLGIFTNCGNLNCAKELQTTQDFEFNKQLIKMRKNNPILTEGEFKLYAPADGVFSYFRILNEKKVLVLVNDNSNEKMIVSARYQDELNGFSHFKDLMFGDHGMLGAYFIVPKHSIVIYELMP